MTAVSSKIFKIAVVLLVVGGGWYFWHISHRQPPEERFKTAEIKRGALIQSIPANGTLNPVVLVNVGTQVSGTVKTLKVDFNDRVRQGQVLAELDPATLQAQARQSEASVASAEASLELAEANARRSDDLFRQQFISAQAHDQAVQSLKAARAQLQLAKAQAERDRVNLGYSVIRSPVSGIVIDRQIDVGQTVAASFQTPTLFKIAQDLRRMQIDSSFAEADIGHIRVGQEVSFTVDAFSERLFKGIVKQVRLNPTIQSNVVTYNVVVSVDNPDEILLPGMTAYVNILVDRRADTLMVPTAALRYRPAGQTQVSGRHLYLLQNGQPVAVEVKTGITDGKMIEVLSPALKEGMKVIIEERKEGGDKSGEPQMRMF